MSVVTRPKTLTEDEIEDADKRVDRDQILLDDMKSRDTISQTIQYATEKTSLNYSSNCSADSNKPEGSNVTEYKKQNIFAKIGDRDVTLMTMIRGKNRGSKKYVWAGYKYARDGSTLSFRCSNRTLYNCLGRVIIKNGEITETQSHSHPREPLLLEIERVKEEMIQRAENDESILFRTIYLEACKAEPLVMSHISYAGILYRMKKARNEKLNGPRYCVKSNNKGRKTESFNFEWTRDWLQILYKKNDKVTKAYCNICKKSLSSPTKTRLYHHFLSKTHKLGMLGLYHPNSEKFRNKENCSDKLCKPNETIDLSDENSEEEDMDGIESLDRVSEQLERTISSSSSSSSEEEDIDDIKSLDRISEKVNQTNNASRELKKQKTDKHESCYREIARVKNNPDEENHDCSEKMTQSTQKIKSLSKVEDAATISVHVLDPSTGLPITELEISLYQKKNDDWRLVCNIPTNSHAQCSDLLNGENLNSGLYKLKFDTQSYYSKRNQSCVYPYIEIVFHIGEAAELYQFLVQLSPYSYNICRLSSR